MFREDAGMDRKVALVIKNGEHCKENRICVFLFWELRGLSPNFHSHVSVSDFYIPKIGPIFPAAE
jgi:hypothetical protein